MNFKRNGLNAKSPSRKTKSSSAEAAKKKNIVNQCCCAYNVSVDENEISRLIVDSAVEVHRELGGPGLLEDVYEEALAQELRLRGLLVERQVPIRIVYKGRVLHKPLRLDMRIEKLVLIDNKATTEWNTVFQAQMLTYLRLTGLRIGLVINFGERLLKTGVHRVVNGLPESFTL